MTPSRYLAALVVIAALVFVAVLPPRPSGDAFRPRDPYASATFRARAHYRGAMERLILARIRDSLVAVLGEAPSRDIAFIDDTVPPSLPSFLTEKLAAERRLFSIPEAGRPGVFHAALVPAFRFAQDEAQHHYAPAGAHIVTGTGFGRGTCVHTIVLSNAGMERLVSGASPATAQQRPAWRGRDLALGPCLFYEAFGRPGARIEAWLIEHRFGLALTGDTTTDTSRHPTAADITFGFEPAMTMCAAGRADKCRRALLEPRMWYSRDWPPRWAVPVGPSRIGSEGSHFLADMASAVGHDRFARFWTSELAPDSAFAAATGKDLGAWASDWAGAHYGAFEASPRPSARSFFLAFGLVAAAAGWGITFAVRRQV